MKLKPVVKRLKPSDNPQLRAIAKQIGRFIEYWGFKRIHGEIWAYLFLSSRPLCTRELIELTQSTKGTISRSLGELIAYGVINERAAGLNGMAQYEANPEVGKVIAGVLQKRERVLIGEIQEAFVRARKSAALHQREPIAISPERAATLDAWIGMAGTTLDQLFKLSGTRFDPFVSKRLKLTT